MCITNIIESLWQRDKEHFIGWRITEKTSSSDTTLTGSLPSKSDQKVAISRCGFDLHFPSD